MKRVAIFLLLGLLFINASWFLGFRRESGCVFITDQSVSSDSLIAFLGTASQVIHINFGDGITDNIVLTGGSTVDTVFHTYPGSAKYRVVLSGALDQITRLDIISDRSSINLSQVRKFASLDEFVGKDCTGDLSDLSLSDFNIIDIRGPVEGDISDLAGSTFGWVSGYLGLNGCDLTYTTFSIPSTWWNGQITNCGLSTSEVDQLIIDWDAYGYGLAGHSCFLGLLGNAARTSASDAAKASLISKSYTVYFEE